MERGNETDEMLPKLKLLIQFPEWKKIIISMQEKVMPLWDGYKALFQPAII